MTFKHIKFYDSFTMRSLERVARDKGWIHETPITKIAVLQETDFSVSNNLTENVMKLCAGLRASGMQRYANEVESKFMNYKQAQTLYETSKEKGEDLVDEAHPKGSHKVSEIEGDSVIETIIDQHLAGLKLTEKKPSGKLASASQILKQVRIVLGGVDFLVKQAAPTNDQVAAYKDILSQTSTMLLNIAKKLETAPSEQIGLNWNDPKVTANTLKRWAAVLNGAVKSGVSAGSTDALISALTNIKKMRDTVQVFDEENADANRMAAGMIDHIVGKLEQISWSIQHPDFTPPTGEYEGSTFSKAKSGYHWEAKYVMPEEKAEKAPEESNLISVSDIKNILNTFANQIQQDVLSKEDQIYQPVPDNDTNRINIMDKAFDRAETFKNQLLSFSASLKGDKMTTQQLAALTSSFPMFKGRVSDKNSLVDFASKIKKSIYDAIGIKQ